MKSFIFYLVIILTPVIIRGQTDISFGLTPAFTINFNTPTKCSRLNEFKIKTNYASFNGGLNILFEHRKVGIKLGLYYGFNHYGWQVTYEKNSNNGSIYNIDELKLSTESLSADLLLSLLLTTFFHNKASLYYSFGGGYSLITHTQLYGHYRTITHNSYLLKVLRHNQAGLGTKTSSPFFKTGLYVQAVVKKVGKINYGANFVYYFNALPEMDVKLVINSSYYSSRFETKHCYVEFFLTYYIFNLTSRGRGDILHKINYR